MSDKILRPKDLCEILGISSVTLWRIRKKKSFPNHINVSERAIGWKESVIMEWLDKNECDDS